MSRGRDTNCRRILADDPNRRDNGSHIGPRGSLSDERVGVIVDYADEHLPKRVRENAEWWAEYTNILWVVSERCERFMM